MVMKPYTGSFMIFLIGFTIVLNTLNSFFHAADKCNGKFKFVSLFIPRPSGGW